LSQKTTMRCRPVRSRPVILRLVLTGQEIGFRESILTAYLSGAHTTLSAPAPRRPSIECGTGATQIEPLDSDIKKAGQRRKPIENKLIVRVSFKPRFFSISVVLAIQRFWHCLGVPSCPLWLQGSLASARDRASASAPSRPSSPRSAPPLHTPRPRAVPRQFPDRSSTLAQCALPLLRCHRQP
jgi:hypothetical protein